jgi:hypothetical protein
MKKLILFLFIFLTIFISCNKEKPKEAAGDPGTNVDSLIYHRAIPGGCALGFESFRQNDFYETDTVIYNINADSLFIFVGFNVSCGPDYSTTANISDDTIYMYLNRNEGPFANCMCYFTYEFQFSGIQQSYYYVVNIDDWKFFYGYIEYLPE